MMLPSHMMEDSPKKKSEKQERRAAKSYGGNTVAGSGSGREKGDVNLFAGIKLEAKRTDKDSMSVKKEWLSKIEEEAFAARKLPAVELEFGDQVWVMIPKREFLEYIEYVREFKND